MCVCSVAHLCPTLCDPMDCSLPGSSIHGNFQARILEWIAISSSRASSGPRDWTLISCVFCIAGRLLNTEPSESGQSQGLRFKFGFKLSAYLNLMAQMVKNLPAMWETWVQSLVWEDPLEEGMATHSSILAWRIPWTEESGGRQSMESRRIWRNWSDTHRHIQVPRYCSTVYSSQDMEATYVSISG